MTILNHFIGGPRDGEISPAAPETSGMIPTSIITSDKPNHVVTFTFREEVEREGAKHRYFDYAGTISGDDAEKMQRKIVE